MGMREKLAAIRERRQQLEQELTDLRTVKDDSRNSALADLESILMSELDQVQAQIDQINSYIQNVDHSAAAGV